LQVLQALDRYHDDRAMAFVSVLQSLVVSIATWHNDSPGGKYQASSEYPAIVEPRRPSCEAVRTFLREYSHQLELSDRLMDTDEAVMNGVNDEVKDSEAGRTIADDDNDANMMCDDSKREPPDHIKLVMEVSILTLFKTVISIENV